MTTKLQDHFSRRSGLLCRRLPAAASQLAVVVLLITMVTGQILRNEPLCLAQGGICAVRHSCPPEMRFNRTGLCPEQEPSGGVCCAGLPNNVNYCQQHGGRCGGNDDCRNVQNFGRLDCEEGKSCCLLIF